MFLCKTNNFSIHSIKPLKKYSTEAVIDCVLQTLHLCGKKLSQGWVPEFQILIASHYTSCTSRKDVPSIRNRMMLVSSQTFQQMPRIKSGPVLCFFSQHNVSAQVHDVTLIKTVKNLVHTAHLLCFYSLYLTPSHVLAISSRNVKVSGTAYGEVSQVESTTWSGLSRALDVVHSHSWSFCA